MTRKTDVSLVVFFLLFLFHLDSSHAFEKSVKSSEGVLLAQPAGPVVSANTTALAPTTMDELRMFWEDKELYVETATRYGKLISQVAENVTIITAKEIQAMNAHTVAEILNRVSGVSIDFNSGMDFGGTSFFHIQGSEQRHVLVLVDGITWNLLSDGFAETKAIPVRIIERIEIIKGPGSSVWGSSLGGVVNIITKQAGDTRLPSGTIIASYGERKTQDDSAELFGKVKGIGYYLFAGIRDSDGLKNSRYFRTDELYSKIKVPLGKGVSFGISAGYSEPHLSYGNLHSEPPVSPFVIDFTSKEIDRAFFATANFDAALSKDLSLNTSFYVLEQKTGRTDKLFLPAFNLLFRTSIFNWKEKTTGGSAKLLYKHGIHAAVLGVDISHGSLDQSQQRTQGAAVTTSVTNPDIDKWAIYLNDTLTIDKLSVTPGIRHDHNSISGSFTSPSLGATYKLADRLIARASVARGFTLPPLGWSSGSGLFQDPNPDLTMEKVWSYQAGIESGLTDYLWLKATVFQHDMEKEMTLEPVAAKPGYSMNVNKGDVKRTGYEIEAETAPFYGFTLRTGFATARIEPEQGATPRDTYSYNAGLKYDDKKSLMAQLFGNYVWWNLASDKGARYNTFVWDFNLAKRIFSTDMTSTEVFLAVHNLFNASYFTLNVYPNPNRWAEAGIRFKF
ncbi:MAG: TonB-dependent receptor [Deltaproteobacteria bacterium]|nr:TonB-dependent receptor [Deltaproteobacteria bacterium]